LGKAKHKVEVEHMLNIGYAPKDIIKVTNIPKSTVYRDVKSLKSEAKVDFENLMTEDYTWVYYKTLENYDKTIIACNKELEKFDEKYDKLEKKILAEMENIPDNKIGARVNLYSSLIALIGMRTSEKMRILNQRDTATNQKAKILNAGPVVFKVNEYVRQHSGTLPARVYDHPMLQKYKGDFKQVEEKQPKVLLQKEATQQSEITVENLSSEDFQVLQDMKDDEFNA
jgi:hypothetical protein